MRYLWEIVKESARQHKKIGFTVHQWIDKLAKDKHLMEIFYQNFPTAEMVQSYLYHRWEAVND